MIKTSYFQRKDFMDTTFEYVVGNAIKGDYLEFGVHSATTFRMAYDSANEVNFDGGFWAYDSFMGLPESDHVFKKNQYSMTRAKFEKATEHIDKHIVEGWFTELEEKPDKAAFIYIDCDLYSSTRLVLDFIKDTLQLGTVIAFDDYFNYLGQKDQGESRAFTESGLRDKCVEYKTFGAFGKSFIYQGGVNE